MATCIIHRHTCPFSTAHPLIATQKRAGMYSRILLLCLRSDEVRTLFVLASTEQAREEEGSFKFVEI